MEIDPTAPEGFNVVVCESTYGGRDRFERSEEGRREILAREVNDAAARKGALLIPSFAVERTQELVTDLVKIIEQGKVPPTKIYIDSPLAARATEIFVRHSKSMEHGEDLGRAFASDYVKSTASVEDSKALAKLRGFRIIIAASGMCDAGRIRHHLKNHLWHESTTVLLAGYQADGSLGRVLQDGASMVTIMGEQIKVKAAIRQIDDYSGHADGPELVQWVKERFPITGTVFLTHGEEQEQLALENDLKGVGVAGDCITRPRLDDVYDISGEGCALLADETKPRVDPGAMGRRDANNELQAFLADIQEQLRDVSDREKAVILGRLRKALSADGRSDYRDKRT